MIRVLRFLLPYVLLPACALQPDAPPQPEFIVPPQADYVSELFGYSQAVRVGPWVTVSAVPGFDIQKFAFPADYPDQVAAAFVNLQMILEAAGARMEDVVEITTYQLDMDKFNDTVDGRNEAFGLHKPTWTAVGAKSLPLPSMQFQVSARAYAPQDFRKPPGAAPQPAKDPVEAKPTAAKRTPEPFSHRPGY